MLEVIEETLIDSIKILRFNKNITIFIYYIFNYGIYRT